jgi:hypothetical protein
MSRSQLKVYYGPPAENREPGVLKDSAPGNRVTLPLGEVLPLLADAVKSQRTWLADFEDDPISISTDLYEVLLAYQHFRRPSA